MLSLMTIVVSAAIVAGHDTPISQTDENRRHEQQLRRHEQQLAHQPIRGPDGQIRCGTTIPDEEHDDAEDPTQQHGRSLAKSDCTMSLTNPLEEYSPAAGPILRINTVVHVISDGANGVISQACVESGIAWLNRDFRAQSGSKSADSVDTRIEFVLSQTLFHDNAAWMNQDHGTSGGFWTAGDLLCCLSLVEDCLAG